MTDDQITPNANDFNTGDPLDVAEYAEDLPTRSDASLRISIAQKKGLLRDVLGAVVRGNLSSVQIAGDPGIGKSRICSQFLKSLDVDFVECTGVLTTPAAVKKLQENPDKVFLLDDVFGCAGDPKFHHVLLEAVGPADESTGLRSVHYETKLGTQVFDFAGRFIFVSNSGFAGAKRSVIAALESRMVIHRFSLTTAEIESEVYGIAELGFDRVDRSDAIRVATRLLRECRQVQIAPSIRMYVSHAIPLFIDCRQGKMTRTWEEHIVTLVHRGHSPVSRPDRDRGADSQTSRRELLVRVLAEHDSRPEQVRVWCEQTGHSPATFYRDLQKLAGSGGSGSQSV